MMTISDYGYAYAIDDCRKRLNAAMQAAARAGLLVDIEVLRTESIGTPAENVIKVHVARPILPTDANEGDAKTFDKRITAP